MSAPGIESGQVWRSVVLRDYAVRLVRPLHDDYWLVEPDGPNAYGGVMVREQHLLNPDLYRLESPAPVAASGETE